MKKRLLRVRRASKISQSHVSNIWLSYGRFITVPPKPNFTFAVGISVWGFDRKTWSSWRQIEPQPSPLAGTRPPVIHFMSFDQFTSAVQHSSCVTTMQVNEEIGSYISAQVKCLKWRHTVVDPTHHVTVINKCSWCLKKANSKGRAPSVTSNFVVPCPRQFFHWPSPCQNHTQSPPYRPFVLPRSGYAPSRMHLCPSSISNTREDECRVLLCTERCRSSGGFLN